MIHFKGCYPHFLPFQHLYAANPDATTATIYLQIKVSTHVHQDLQKSF